MSLSGPRSLLLLLQQWQVPMGGRCPHHPSQGGHVPPWALGAAYPLLGSPATFCATLAPPVLALPVGGLGPGGVGGGMGTPAAVWGPDSLLFFLHASGPGGAVFVVQGPEWTGRMGSGWRGEWSQVEEGLWGEWCVTHLLTQGCHGHGVRSRCPGTARDGRGDGGGGGLARRHLSPALPPRPWLLAGGLISGDSSAGKTMRAAAPPRPRPVPAAAMCEMR